MDTDVLNKANIHNLTSLWKKMGVEQPSQFTRNQSLFQSISWPNRYWSDWDAETGQVSELAKAVIKLPEKGILPIWHGAAETPGLLEQLLIDNGFTISFEQTAMYLDLTSHAVRECRPTDVSRISSLEEVEVWAKVSSEAFAYDIDAAVIHKVAADPGVQLLLTRSQGQAAATALLYRTADVIGVHQLGVAKHYQGKGIASSLMQYIIRTCKDWNGRYIVLQASAEAESLYLRLGFNQQFRIRNYQRKYAL